MRKQALRSLAQATALVAFAGLSAPAMAADGDAHWQVKVLGTAVLPDGKIDKVDLDLVGLPAGTQTKANDNYVPTVAIEYFFTPDVSLETICCVTQHDVDAVSGLPAGSELVSNAKLVPATFTLKYHLNAGGVSPYVGAGPAYFLWLDVNPGATAKAVGATKTTLSNEFGFALQAGLDVPVSKSMTVSLDAKRYFIDTTARWYAGGTKVIQTQHQLDPWVLSAGVGFRF